MTKPVRVDLVMPPELKAAAMEASKEIRGGLSRVVRELLAEWVKKQKARPR